MQVPSILQGESLKRLMQGAAAGAVATIFVGFYWGGWSLGSTADKMAKERSELAVVAALAHSADEGLSWTAPAPLNIWNLLTRYELIRMENPFNVPS
jgi:hypothetical protein